MKEQAPSSIRLEAGVEILHKGRRKFITHILDFGEVLVIDAESKKTTHAKIADLKIPGAPENTPVDDVTEIPEEEWAKAQRKYGAIEPLLNLPGRKRSDVEKRAKELNVHANTLYDWIRTYERTGRITAFLTTTRRDKGSSRLSSEIEAVIQSVIEKEYLTTQKKSVEAVWIELKTRCRNAGLKVPAISTLRRRIENIDKEKKIESRLGKKALRKRDPIRGQFPGADWPLSVVQIDHTKVDLILLDDIHRLPIGRPWITVAIDVFSRMVLGFYISFDPPGAMSTGLCIAHCVLPKEKWLAERGVSGEWPCWGVPNKIHADNAREFRGEMLKRACKDYGIELEWRPVTRPHYGAHIERQIGTSMNEVHTLPGTTFSNTSNRGDYDSESKAIMTLWEFEAWFASYIVNEYHNKKHKSLGIPPIAMYRQGIFGDEGKPGIGLPARIADEERLRLDLMPYEKRTIQPYGVVIDDIFYYHDVLRVWINAPDPKSKKVMRKFTFRRDPRDISVIWFLDPELNQYFPIPYRNTSHPPISVWELREAKRRLKEEGGKYDNEDAIFESYERRREMEAEAAAKTKSARRANQRRRHVPGTMVKPTAPESTAPQEPVQEEAPSEDTEEIVPFDDLDDLTS